MVNDPKRANYELLIAVVLALAVFAVYRPVAFFEFNNYDDAQYITDNPHVLRGITPASVIWAFTSGYASNWHPLTWISHQLDCRLFGLDAGGHHLMNVVFHALNTLLLFGWLRKWTRELWPSLLVAALFAWHPMHVESVAWVAERKDVLSAFFGLLTLWAYGVYAVKPERGPYALVCLCYALGLMSKPMLVSLPLVLLLLDFWPLRRVAGCKFPLPGAVRNKPGGDRVEISPEHSRVESVNHCGQVQGSSGYGVPPSGGGAGAITMIWKTLFPPDCAIASPAKAGNPYLDAITVRQFSWMRLALEKIPLAVLAAASCVVTYLVQQAGGSVVQDHSLGFRLANAANSYVVYLGKLLWPRHLAVFYPYVHEFHAARVIAAAALLVVITGGVCALARKRPYWLVGWFWFLITLGPVIGLVQVGGQAYADRYTYIPAIGLFIIVAWELRRLTIAFPRSSPLVVVGVCAVLAACILVTSEQLGYWENSLTLFSHAIEVAPDSAVAHSNLGEAYASRGRERPALEQFDAALAIEPNHEAALNNKGALLFGQGKTDEAVALFNQTLRFKPDSDMARNNLGMILFRQGKTAEAIAQFRAALRTSPEYGSARANLGLALTRAGDPVGAMYQFRAAVNIAPNPRAENGIGLIARQLGRLDEAARHFAIAVLLQPDFAEARDNLGAVLNAQGRFADAEPQIRAALRFIPGSAEAHFNLANSCAGLKQTALASAEYAEALRLATIARDTELTARIKEGMRLNPPPGP